MRGDVHMCVHALSMRMEKTGMCLEREPHLFGGVCLLRRGTMLKYQCRQGDYDTYGKYKAIF